MKDFVKKINLVFFLFAIAFFIACPGSIEGDPIPSNQFYYPGSMTKLNNSLFVVNTNNDRQYKSGSVLEIDILDIINPKILRFTEVPSLGAEILSYQKANNPKSAFVLLATRDQGRITNIKENKFVELDQSSPYYLKLFSDKKSGLIGYMFPASAELWSETKKSLVSDQCEFDYFELDTNNLPQIKRGFNVSDCMETKNQDYRQMARLGGLEIVGDEAFLLAEYIVKPDTKPEQKVFLLRFAKSTIVSGKIDSKSCVATDITDLTGGAMQARSLAISTNETGKADTAYALLDGNPTIAALSLPTDASAKASLIKSNGSCRGPVQIKLSPDKASLVVACAKSNQVVLYDAESLSPLNIYQGGYLGNSEGRGPVDILFDPQDQSKKQFFVNFQLDSRIGIFKYENASPNSRSMLFERWLKLPR